MYLGECILITRCIYRKKQDLEKLCPLSVVIKEPPSFKLLIDIMVTGTNLCRRLRRRYYSYLSNLAQGLTLFPRGCRFPSLQGYPDMEKVEIFPWTRFVNNQNFRKEYIYKFLTITLIIVEIIIHKL